MSVDKCKRPMTPERLSELRAMFDSGETDIYTEAPLIIDELLCAVELGKYGIETMFVEVCKRTAMLNDLRSELRRKVERCNQLRRQREEVYRSFIKMKAERDALQAEVERLRVQLHATVVGGLDRGIYQEVLESWWAYQEATKAAEKRCDAAERLAVALWDFYRDHDKPLHVGEREWFEQIEAMKRRQR